MGNGTYSYTGSVQTFTATQAGTYDIIVKGAQGGADAAGDLGGKGAEEGVIVTLAAGERLSVVVGGQGVAGTTTGSYRGGGGGGGGSFVVETFNGTAAVSTPIVIAGGGGGAYKGAGSQGVTATSGTAGFGGSPGAGGTNGNGGQYYGTKGYYGGGGGLKSAGGTGHYGGGGLGGGAAATGRNTYSAGLGSSHRESSGLGGNGGYGAGGGGGGSTDFPNYGGGGGGGGYSGGGGGNGGPGAGGAGGGGGSFTSGTVIAADQISGANTGNGSVVIQLVCFAAGTLIRTARGDAIVDVAVEALAIGDLAMTASGARRPIKWLAHRTLSIRHTLCHSGSPQANPEPGRFSRYRSAAASSCPADARPGSGFELRSPRNDGNLLTPEAWPIRIAAHALGPTNPRAISSSHRAMRSASTSSRKC